MRRARRCLAGLSSADDYVDAVIMDVYRSVVGSRHFWHAAIIRGVKVPEFWVPFRESGLRRIKECIRLRTEELGRELSAQEIRDIRFAFQMVNGVINNGILNRPGPIMLETREFEVALLRSFRAVAAVCRRRDSPRTLGVCPSNRSAKLLAARLSRISRHGEDLP